MHFFMFSIRIYPDNSGFSFWKNVYDLPFLRKNIEYM